MQLTGIDMQRISLGALIIALALLVDDAMTTTDAMLTRLAQGDDKVAGRDVRVPDLRVRHACGHSRARSPASCPVGFAASSAGEYTFSLFAVVGIALLVSWFVAVVFAPLPASSSLLKLPMSRRCPRPRLVSRVLTWYSRVPDAGDAREVGNDCVTAALFGAAMLAVPLIPNQFFPAFDRPELVVDLRSAPECLDPRKRERRRPLRRGAQGPTPISRAGAPTSAERNSLLSAADRSAAERLLCPVRDRRHGCPRTRAAAHEARARTPSPSKFPTLVARVQRPGARTSSRMAGAVSGQRSRPCAGSRGCPRARPDRGERSGLPFTPISTGSSPRAGCTSLWTRIRHGCWD